MSEVVAIESVQTLDNYVINYWKSSPKLCTFLLTNAYSAMLSYRAHIIFNPFPKTWNKFIENIKEEDTEITFNNVEEVKNAITKLGINKNITKILLEIEKCYNDIELLDTIGIYTYELIKFILVSNKILIKQDTIFSENDISLSDSDILTFTKQGYDKNIKYMIPLWISNILQFKIQHTEIVEDRFKDKDTKYLYHGSRSENWYSIMYNGIKIGSSNKFMLNGAAYGYGIYLSDSINTSLSYSLKDKTNNQYIVLSIFQVINGEKYKKQSNIFVVNNEDDLILRYLLVFQDLNIPHYILNSFDKKLNFGDLKKEEIKKSDMERKIVSTIHNKRLMKEYQAIIKQSPDKLGFQTKLAEEDKLDKWIIYLTKPENSKLEEQMKRLSIPHIEIEITFKENYPIAPPFIRVVYPHFKFHSGHITIGGSLCMEMLTNQGWTPTFNIENVITQIKLALSDGNGEIDEHNYSLKYTLKEAHESFKRVMEAHGWV
jgi:ubiquitin-protein ligase